MKIHVIFHNAEDGELHRKLDQILANQEILMATIEQVIEKIEEMDTKVDGVRALITGLREQVAALLNAAPNIPQDVKDKIDQAFDKATAVSQEITDAVTENTPPEPVPPTT